jgi:secreted trypsin-like serine protease
MLKYVTVLVLVGVSMSMSLPGKARIDCGVPAIKPDTTRIVGGKEAKQHSWPWMAALFKNSFGSWYQFCGATLIHPEWVLTAGHCFYRETNVNNFKVKLGAHNKAQAESTQFEALVSEIHVHSEYNPSKTSHDMTLLKLKEPVNFTSEISPICVADTTDFVADGEMGWLTGWGTLSAGGSSSNVLMQVSVPVVKQEKCELEYPGRIDDTMICGGFDEGGKDTCQGDSGGPWQFQKGTTWTQFGITSWGRGCAQANYAGVYGRVTALREFINKYVPDV